GRVSGSGMLVKQGAGVLTLDGNNSYAGGTLIEDGTLRISSDANLGAAAGALTFDGGALRTSADIASARDVTLLADGLFLTDAGTQFALGGVVSGAGALVKSGAGVL